MQFSNNPAVKPAAARLRGLRKVLRRGVAAAALLAVTVAQAGIVLHEDVVNPRTWWGWLLFAFS